LKIILIILAILGILAALIPLLASKKWWIRAFDFPHLQFTVFSFVVCVLLAFQTDLTKSIEVVLLLLLLGTLIYQCMILYPYTFLAKKQLADAQNPDKKNSIKILAANVYQDNKQTELLLDLINKCNPDVIILLETNLRWQKELQSLKEEYTYAVEHPLENFYGMMLFSKFQLSNMKVRFLIDDEIPSIKGKVKLKSGISINLHCLHPMPPSPTENEKSLDRDAELLLVAKEITETDYPVLVIGDLNDVAWSHTTRMFQRVSRLLDPRIGRGFYNTFHAKHSLMRWPLDHFFVSNDFKLVSLKVLPDIGSDHFPVFAELVYCTNTTKNGIPNIATPEDKVEVKETIKNGLEENGKSPS
jgi:endonuclease/exonuclease/phosphatase (EEP) superfamily protein YafD